MRTDTAKDSSRGPGLAAWELGRALAAVWRDPETKALPVVAGALVLTGTLFYWRFEDWTVIEALYFCIVTLATVGFPRLHPDHRWNADLHDLLHPHRLRRARRLADLGRGEIHRAEGRGPELARTPARPSSGATGT